MPRGGEDTGTQEPPGISVTTISQLVHLKEQVELCTRIFQPTLEERRAISQRGTRDSAHKNTKTTNLSKPRSGSLPPRTRGESEPRPSSVESRQGCVLCSACAWAVCPTPLSCGRNDQDPAIVRRRTRRLRARLHMFCHRMDPGRIVILA